MILYLLIFKFRTLENTNMICFFLDCQQNQEHLEFPTEGPSIEMNKSNRCLISFRAMPLLPFAVKSLEGSRGSVDIFQDQPGHAGDHKDLHAILCPRSFAVFSYRLV